MVIYNVPRFLTPVSLALRTIDILAGEVDLLWNEVDSSTQHTIDQWFGAAWPDGQLKSSGNSRPEARYPFPQMIEKARKLIVERGYAGFIDVVPSDDGITGTFHAYSKDSRWFGPGKYIGAFVFDLRGDDTHMLSKFEDARRSVDLGRIVTTARDVAVTTDLTVKVAAVFIPGPQDLLLGKVIQVVVVRAGRLGISMAWQGGKWVYRRAGKVLTGAAEKETELVVSKLLKEELGATRVRWDTMTGEYRKKHIQYPIKGMSWSEVIKSTVRGPAKYKEGEDVELIERTVHRFGTPCTNPAHPRWKYLEFDRVIGASAGRESRWVRVEENGHGTNIGIHGHPVPYEEFVANTRPR